jgi:cyclophilin family peptidyl-prolyl cis-trans isomerase
MAFFLCAAFDQSFYLACIVNPMNKYLFSALILAMMASCASNNEQTFNRFSDPVFKEIADCSDQRMTQRLIGFLSNPDPQYSAYAAQCLGSFGDSIPVAALLPYASVQDSALSSAAAWAIGQKADSLSCAPLFAAWEQNNQNKAILSAIAKSTPATSGPAQERTIQFFGTLALSDRALTEAFCDALYHLHYRTISDPLLFDKLMSTFIPSNDLWLRKAQAIGRYRGILREEHSNLISDYLDRSLHADIALALIPSMLNFSDTSATHFIHQKLMADSLDPRVELLYTNVILRKSKMDENILMDLMDRVSPNAQRSVLEQCVNYAISDTLTQYLASMELADSDLAAYSHFFKWKAGLISEVEFMEIFHQLPAGYERIPYASIIAKLPEGHRILFEETMATSHLGLRYALAEQWIQQLPSEENTKALESNIHTLWQLNDLGITALICEAIPSKFQYFENPDGWITDMEQQLKTYVLPQEVETYEAVRQCLEKVDPQNRLKPSHTLSHPIDWELAARIPSNAQVQVETSKGRFTIQLNVDNAPGSVVNFVSLMQSGFYDLKYFHRMVPNFVIQGGCPRGDGMGSTPYTIRSEFSPLTYHTGTIGLASSGRDTESCQWFMSHLPTPHLDGRYTILGVVVSGLSVAQQLRIGDQIISIRPLNFT